MLDELKYWFKHDKFNISLTLLCALISILPSISSILPSGGKSDDNFFQRHIDLLKEIGQFLIALIGFVLVSRRFMPMALGELSAKSSLQDYIDDVCAIKQTKGNDSHFAYKVVRGIVNQFYNMWMLVWAVWVVSYGIDIFNRLSICPENKTYVKGIKYILDFAGSAAMFAIYVILNDITVEISKRSGNRYSHLPWYGISIVLLFMVVALLGIDCEVSSNIAPREYLRLILSAFGCLSFVLVLGKLNSNFLNVPKLFMIFLYCYAVAQAYSFLAIDTTKTATDMTKAYPTFVNLFNASYYYVTSLGKVVLLITLSWMLSRKRLIFYLVNRSLSMTDVQSKLKEFNRYMG